MLKQYDDRPPAALARGPMKASDIERVRREMVNAQHVAGDLAAREASRGQLDGIAAGRALPSTVTRILDPAPGVAAR